ncbi:FAD-dependent monooxygenase [Nocardia noduli]|uniref:FAD-dependent monooxygenase n=1 Tax=Nocardia noduli TaxID=2815722 RepID=UPI001C21307E|nr:FAD-dependent monooxygenase [Nocardia noduli]
MPAINNVLVVGGGTAGAAGAILLAEAGVTVDLIEINPDITALGSGITLQGNALRVLNQLGIWERISRAGYVQEDWLGLRAPDAEGTLLARVPSTRTGGPDLPATLGIDRPTLARILIERVAELPIRVRTGLTFTDLVQQPDSVTAHFSDGSVGTYDLVIGADGVRSHTRRYLGIDAEIRSTGLGAWRAIVPRPESITHTEVCYGGPSYIAGFGPINEHEMYAFFTEDAQDRTALTADERLAVMRRFAEKYHGPWDVIHPTLTETSRVHYTWFESYLAEGPWHRGRVVLIGDAVHTCPPTVAQGAAMALEDAQVLAELLLGNDVLDDALLNGFAVRRLARVRPVIEATLQIVEWVLAHEHSDIPRLMAEVATIVTEPA